MATVVIFALFGFGVATIAYGFHKHPPLTEWKEAIKNHDKPEEKDYIAKEDKLRQNYVLIGMTILMLALIIGF